MAASSEKSKDLKRVREGASERVSRVKGRAVLDVKPEEQFDVRRLEPCESDTVDEGRRVDRKVVFAAVAGSREFRTP